MQLPLAVDDPVGVRPVAIERIDLDRTSWIDVGRGWLAGADALLTDLLDGIGWEQRTRELFDEDRIEPRLSGRIRRPSEHPALPPMARALGDRYGRRFDTVFANLYRDGRDSVAWHRDRIHRTQAEPLVAVVSLGAARTFRLRPHGGGGGRGLRLGSGDLLVMGGRCQHDWEHSVPKSRRVAGTRISVTLRPARDAA